MLSKAEKTFKLGYRQRVLLPRRLGNELLLDVRLDGLLDLGFEKVKFVALLNALEPSAFEDGLKRGVGELILAFKPSPGGVLVAIIIKLNHPTC